MEWLEWSRVAAGRRAVKARLVSHASGGGWREHGHDYIETFCVLEGRLQHMWDGVREDLVPGDMVAVIPGERHQAWVGREGVTILNVSCSGEALAWLRERADGLATPWDGARDQRRHVLGIEARAMLRAVVATLDPTTVSGRDFMLLALVQALHAEGAVQRLPLWLERGLSQHLDAGDVGGISALAKRCGCSREHLSRMVRQMTGLTAVRLLRERRIARAAQLLRSSDMSIPAIAAAVGFRSQSAFYAAFAQLYAQSPAAWRATGSALPNA